MCPVVVVFYNITGFDDVIIIVIVFVYNIIFIDNVMLMSDYVLMFYNLTVHAAIVVLPVDNFTIIISPVVTAASIVIHLFFISLS